MATTHISSVQKLHLYYTFSQLNRAFRALSFYLRALEQTGQFQSERLREYQGLSRELQSEVNCELLEDLLNLERKDAFTFGKVRAARSKRLKG